MSAIRGPLDPERLTLKMLNRTIVVFYTPKPHARKAPQPQKLGTVEVNNFGLFSVYDGKKRCYFSTPMAAACSLLARRMVGSRFNESPIDSQILD